MKADIRVIVKGVQQYADYIDEIVTNAIGKYSIVNGLHIVEYRELCKGGHIIENKLVISNKSVCLYRSGSLFSEMSFIEGECTESDYINTDGELNVKIKTLSYHPTIGDNNIHIELNYDLYVDIIGYQLFVVNTVEKWMCFLLAYGRKPRFNVFNLILQEKCEFEVAK